MLAKNSYSLPRFSESQLELSSRTGAPLVISTDGFEFLQDSQQNFKKFEIKQFKGCIIVTFSYGNIDGFENPLLKIDGFGRTH